MDSAIFRELEETADKYDREKIYLFNAGVSDEISEIEYGYVQGEQRHTEKITTIDTELSEKIVTFIKMDVETFEIKALEGARRIITEQKPKLSISAYHYLSDLWEVPRKIRELVPEYKLYLRHHAPTVWDTDCYACI